MSVKPPLVMYASEAEYRAHYELYYCRGPLTTFDQLQVWFKKSDFDHCMRESTKGTKDKARFSQVRAQRVDWIKNTLQDPAAELFVGWNGNTGQHEADRRVAYNYGEYLVIIRLTPRQGQARFITAYPADAKTIAKVRSGPPWLPNK